MAVPSKYQAKEVLNKVLNAGEDALNVDLSDSVTVTVDSEFPAAAAITDNFANPTTTSAMSMLMGWDTSTWDRVQIGDGTAASALRVTISTNDSHFGAVGAAADVDGVIHGQLRTIGTAVEIMDDWDESDRAAVNIIPSVVGITAAAGAVASNTPRVTLASDDPGVAKLGEIETTNNANQALLGTIDSDTDDIKTATELIGNAIYVDDADWTNDSSKHMLVGGLYGSNTITSGDVGPLALDPTGALYTREFLGQAGSILVTGTTNAVTTGVSGTKFVAIQFLEDTTFDAGSDGLVASTTGLWPDDNNASATIDDNGGAVTGSEVFPQGMTIFGRWDGFKLDSGKVIGYLGYV
jgi:hypothetical protein